MTGPDDTLDFSGFGTPIESDNIGDGMPETGGGYTAPRRRSAFHPDVDKAIDDAVDLHGADRSYLRTVARIESGGDPKKQTGSYKGIFQLSDDEFRRYGGTGDIFDPFENAKAAALKARTEAAAYEKRHGRSPLPDELYLTHQQGEGGLDGHLRNPDAPAWENMYRTAEGRQKGPAWAKQAVWGNIPQEERKRFGSVDNVTSRDFTDVWSRRYSQKAAEDDDGQGQNKFGPNVFAQAPRNSMTDAGPDFSSFGSPVSGPGEPPPQKQPTKAEIKADEDERRNVVAAPSYEKLVQYGAQKEGVEAEIRQIRKEMAAAPPAERQKYLLRLEEAGQRWKKASELETFARPTGMFDVFGGNLTQEEAKAELDSRIKDVPARLKEEEQLLADLKEFRANKLTDPDRVSKVMNYLKSFGVYATGRDRVDQQVIDVAEGTVKETKKEIQELKEMQSGLRPGFKLSATRSRIENVLQGVGKTFTSIPKYAGYAAGYLGRPFGISDPETNSLVTAMEWVEDLAKVAYPGDPARQNDFSQKLANGAGSMIGFMGVGKATELLTGGGAFARTVGTALTGGASQGSETVEEATTAMRGVRRLKDDKGKTTLYTPEERDRLLAAGWGFILGTSEALPIERAMRRPTGGQLRKIFEHGAIGGLEEGAQEFIQSVGGNVGAKLFYDPTRALFEGTGEATLIGGILGYKMGAGRATLDAWKGRHKEAETDEEHDRIDKSLDTFFTGALARGEIEEKDIEKIRDEIKKERPEALTAFDATVSDWRRGAGVFQPTMTDAQPDNLDQPGNVLAAAGARTGRTSPPPIPDQAVEQPQPQNAPLPPTQDQVSVLQRMGYTLDDIREMEPEQRAAEMEDAAGRGIMPDTAGKSVAPPPIPQAGSVPPPLPGRSQVPDAPTAEPIADILAQTRDLADPKNARQGVYLSQQNLAALAANDAAMQDIAAALDAVKGDVIDNVDGNGGMLIAKSSSIAREIERAIANGEDIQSVLGRATGAGQGKSPDANAVVQQVTPEGAVTRESAVPAGDVDATLAEFRKGGRDARVVTPEQALERRRQGLEPPPLPAGDGSRGSPVKVTTPDDVARAGERVAEPTDGQKEAGNYTKGHIKFQGLDITIENPKGSVRSGVSPDGQFWEVTMPATYGYIKRSKGKDGDQVDVYVGDQVDAPTAFVIDQVNPEDRKLDEHKVMLGFGSRESALDTYRQAFSDGSAEQRIGGITEMPMQDFKAWVERGKRSRPVSKLDWKPDSESVQPAETAAEQPDNKPDTYQGEPLSADEIENALEAWRELTTLDRQLAEGKNIPDAKLDEANLTSAEFVDAFGREHDEFDSEQSLRQYLGGEDAKDTGRAESRSGSQPESRGESSEAAPAAGSGRIERQEAPIVQREQANRGPEGNGSGDRIAEVGKRQSIADQFVFVAPDGTTKPLLKEKGVSAFEAGTAKAKAYVLEMGKKDGKEHGMTVRPDGSTVIASTEGNKTNFIQIDEKQTPELYQDDERVLEFHHNHPSSRSFSAQDIWYGTSIPSLRVLHAHGHNGTSYRAEFKHEAAASGRVQQAYEYLRSSIIPFIQPKLSSGEIDRVAADAYFNHVIAEMLDDAEIIAYQVEFADADTSNAAIATIRSAIGYSRWRQLVAKAKEIVNVPDRRAEPVRDESGVGKPSDQTREGGPGRAGSARSDQESRASTKADRGEVAAKDYSSEKADKPDFSFIPHDGWRDSLIKARVYANALAIDHRGLNLPDLIKAIDKVNGKAATDLIEREKAAKKQAEAKSEPDRKADPLVQIGDKILDEGFDTIVEARKFAQSVGITGNNKTIDEALETAIVGTASRLAQNVATPPQSVYRMLVDLYNKQPNLASRTGTSVANQAYSTPMPLAYIASRLAGITQADSVYEPTAGNGALLIEVVAKGKARVNELDPARAKALRDQGFTVTEKDGSAVPSFKNIDSVIMNPPFGAVKEAGKSKEFQVGDWSTTHIDHAVALNGLEAMDDNGKAVLILGGIKATDIKERRKGYRGQAKREFYFRLYNQYNVVDHFTVDGDLYKKQGAGWPVDVIVIDGRGKSDRALPAANPPMIFDSWEALAEKLPNAANDARAVDRPARNTVEPVSESASGNEAGGETNAGARSERPAAGTEAKPARVRKDAAGRQPGNEGQSAEAQPRDQEPGADRDSGRTDQPVSPRKPRVERKQPPQGSGQSNYESASTAADSLDTLIPVNMADAAKAAMKRVADKHGSVDALVADRLGYSESELAKYFSAEQIDAIAAAIDNADRGAAFIIGDQCVAADTRVYDPVSDTYNEIKALADRGQPIKVLALTPRGFQIVSATSPFKKGTADLYKVTLDDGRSITVTRQHRFLTPSGWLTLASGLREGCFLGSAEGRLLKNLGGYQSIHPEDGSRCNHTPQGYRDDCSAYSYPCGGQPLSDRDNAQEPTPSPSDVLGPIQLWWQKDDLATSIGYSRHHRLSGHQSKNSSSPSENHAPSQTSTRDGAFHGRALTSQLQNGLPSRDGSSSPHQGESAVAGHQSPGAAIELSQRRPESARPLLLNACERPGRHNRASPQPETAAFRFHNRNALPTAVLPGCESSLAFGENTGWRRILSIEYKGHDAFYDMWVPGFENYMAEGFVNHNTGIGKGRIAAGMLRYAMKQGMKPVFVTEKPDLYGDMFRDLRDIGVPEMLGREPSMFITNSGATIPLDEEALAWKQEADAARERGDKLPAKRGKFLSGGTSAKIDATMAKISRGEAMGQNGLPDVIFTTYDQMNTVKGQDTDRRKFISRIASESFVVLDESHNAGGSGQKGWEKKNATPDRAKFVRELAAKAKGVMFSSATYAKRPDVMDLYARTDMGRAVDDPKQLPALIQRGGVPMQQIVASMLANSGQYLRRERSFEGVEYAVEGVKVNQQSYRQFSDAIRAIFKFDLAVKEARKDIMEDILDAKGMAMSKDSGVGESAARTTAFASIMHNIVNQMLLAIKSGQAAQRAIKAVKDGEKPVIALANTNESFISDFADQENVSLGQALDMDFGEVLRRYLARTLRVTIKHPDKTKEHVEIPVERLGPGLQRMYADALAEINDGSFDGMPISPIDWIRHEVGKAGLKVAEVTGRQTMIDYSASTPKYVARPKSEMGPAGKRGSIAAFNRGSLDVLILNRSGSTGVSMHANKTFKDQRRRRMIIAQAEGNIDTHLQMLGRVHRTGQVIPPAYSQIAAEIPAEARPTAVLMKKMASLNANTTGARGSVFMADSVDFMNEIGDKVVADLLSEDAELNDELGGALKVDNDGIPVNEDAARRATGRLVLLTPEKQAEFLERVQSAYKSEVEQLDALGENPLEAKTLDLQAKTIDTTVLKPKQGESAFLDEVRIEKVSVKAQGRAMLPSDVAAKIAEVLKVSKPTGDAPSALRELESKGRAARDAKVRETVQRARDWIKTDIAELSPDAQVSTRKRHEDQVSRWVSTMNVAYPGSRVTLNMPSGEMEGIVMSVERTGKAKLPVALGSWEARIAVPDGSREYVFPLSKLFPQGVVKSEDEKGATIAPSPLNFADMVAAFEEARKEGRETRFMVTGNILGGFDQVAGKGRIVNYTTESGEMRPGVFMGREFDVQKFMDKRAVRFQSGEQVAKFLDKVSVAEVKDTDGNIVVRSRRGEFSIEMPASRAIGGRYYTDPDVRKALGSKDFEKRGNKMLVQSLSRGELVKAIDAIRKIGAILETREAQDVAQGIVGQGAGVDRAVNATGSRSPRSIDAVATSLKMGRAVTIPKPVVETMLGEVRQHLDLMPKGIPAGVVSRIEPNRVKGQPYDAVAVITDTDGGEHRLAINWADLAATRAFARTDGGLVGFLRLSPSELGAQALGSSASLGSGAIVGVDQIAPSGEVGSDLHRPVGRQIHGGNAALAREIRALLAHESIHIRRRRGILRGSLWNRLVAHADNLRVMDKEFGTYLREIGHPDADKQPGGVTIRDIYKQSYGSEADFQERMDQESVAVMVELAEHGQFLPMELEPIADDLNRAFRLASSGKVGPLGGAADYALKSGDIDSQTGQSMRRDLDALGYYSHALEVARGLKQAKGTPEQMLAQLKKAGVKDAEIEATGLSELFKAKSGSTTALESDAITLPPKPVWNEWDSLVAGVPKAARSVGEFDLLAERAGPDYVTYKLVDKGSTFDVDTGIHGTFRVKSSPNGGIEVTNARIADESMQKKGLGTRVYDIIQKDFAPAELMPSSWNQLSPNAFAFWAKRDPKKLAWMRTQLAVRGEKDMYPDRIIPQQQGDRTAVPTRRALLNQITKSEIISHLEDNRVGVREVGYGTPQDPYWRIKDEESRKALLPDGATEIVKWQSNSLDPSNPTYRETVLHLPPTMNEVEAWQVVRPDGQVRSTYSAESAARSAAEHGDTVRRGETKTYEGGFRSGHFDQPNIIGHMMTSMVKHEGRPVYLIDQIQSDWGQKLRDGGVRDDAKIDRLTQARNNAHARLDETFDKASAAAKNLKPDSSFEQMAFHQVTGISYPASKDGVMAPLLKAVEDADAEYRRIDAELRQSEGAVPGHPLVNTTDQWTTTTLRRAIRQASEAGADYIAIPHGDTVLSYNTGDESGMPGFYGNRTSEGIVPKNLRKLIEKIDKDAARPTRVEKLETAQGLQGWNAEEKYPFDKSQTGFTIFPLTEKVKDSVVEHGQPLFALGGFKAAKRMSAAGHPQILSAYKAAQALASKGKSAADVWRAAGWMQGADGLWRFEIDDSKAKVRLPSELRKAADEAKPATTTKPKRWTSKIVSWIGFSWRPEIAPSALSSGSKSSAPLLIGDVLDHPALYQAYPALKTVHLNLTTSGPMGSASIIRRVSDGKLILKPLSVRQDVAGNAAQFKTTLLHELQHYIQRIEGFAAGSAPNAAQPGKASKGRGTPPVLSPSTTGLMARPPRNRGSRLFGETMGELMVADHEAAMERGDKAKAEAIYAEIINLARVGAADYMAEAGETEARAVEAREAMTATERRASMPELGGFVGEVTTDPREVMDELYRRGGFKRRFYDRPSETIGDGYSFERMSKTFRDEFTVRDRDGREIGEFSKFDDNKSYFRLAGEDVDLTVEAAQSLIDAMRLRYNTTPQIESKYGNGVLSDDELAFWIQIVPGQFVNDRRVTAEPLRAAVKSVLGDEFDIGFEDSYESVYLTKNGHYVETSRLHGTPGDAAAIERFNQIAQEIQPRPTKAREVDSALANDRYMQELITAAGGPIGVRGISAEESQVLFALGSRPDLDMSQETTALASDIKSAVNIIQRIAGLNVEIDMRSTIDPNDIGVDKSQIDATKAAGLSTATAGGYYRKAKRLNGRAIIGLALNDPAYDVRTIAGHEAFHHVEEVLATDAERKLLRSLPEMARMMNLAAAEIGMRPTDPALGRLPANEIRAIAFQRYRRMREEGTQNASRLHIAVRKFFDRLIRVFHAVRNAGQGRGFDSFESIFERARTGGMASRQSLPADARARVGEVADAMASFAGVNAKNSPKSMLNLAERMETKGKKPDAIWKQTGWMRGADQKWRFEIDDSAAAVVNLDGHLKAPKTTIFRSFLGLRPKQQPKWATGKVRVATNVRLPDLLKHDKLYAAYPFLKTMRVNMIVGEGIPKEREGASLVFKKADGRISYLPIQVRARKESYILPSLLHELQHYIQNKEGFVGGAAPSSRDVTLPQLDMSKSRETSPIIYKGMTFSPGTVAATHDEARSRDTIPLFASERVALWLADLYEMRDRGDPGAFETIDRLDEQIRHSQQKLVNMLKVTSQDYAASAGEIEAKDAAKRAALSDEQRRNTMPQTANGVAASTSPDFREIADEVFRRAKVTERTRLERRKPVSLGDGILGYYWDIAGTGSFYVKADGLRDGATLRVFMDRSAGVGTIELGETGTPGADSGEIVPNSPDMPNPLSRDRLHEVIDATETYIRSQNLTPRYEAHTDVLNGDRVNQDQVAFFRERDPSFMWDAPASRGEVVEYAKASYGNKVEVERSGDGWRIYKHRVVNGRNLKDVQEEWDGSDPEMVPVVSAVATEAPTPIPAEYAGVDPEIWKARDDSEPMVAADFDPAKDGSPEIMAALIPTAAKVYSQRWIDRMRPSIDRLRVGIQDKALPIRRREEAIEASLGIRLPEQLQVYLAESLYHGRAGERLTDLQQDSVDPLVEHIRKSGITFDQLGDYLYARHAIERNAAINKIDPANLSGSGMTDAEALATISKHENGKQGQAFKDGAAMVDKIISDTRDLLLKAGLLTRQQYDDWSAKYQFYVPLRGFEGEAADELPRTGRGMDVRGPESKQALGRRSKADNPVGYVLQQAVQAVIRSEKNRVDKTLYRLIQAHPEPDVWQIFKGEARRRLNHSTGLVETYWVPPAWALNGQYKDNIFGVKIAGKQHYMLVLHEPLARALRTPAPGFMDNKVGQALYSAARFYARLVTSYNPEFVVSNYLRDIQTALMNVGDVANKPDGTRKKIVAEALSFKSIRGVMAALQDHEGRTIYGGRRAADENMLGRKRSQDALDYAKWFEEYRLAGGKISFIEMNDVERIKSRIEKSVKEGGARRAIRDVFDLIDNANGAVENGVRLSVYIALRKNGISKDSAASASRELTVNFNRKGEWSASVNALYLFFNASVQGSTRLAQAVYRSPTVRKGVAGIFLAGAVLDVLNYLVAADDDDGENSYEKIKDWVKEKNMIVMLPGRKDFVQIPMPYGYNVFFLSGQKTAALTRTAAGYGKEKPAKALAGLIGAVMESFSPLGAAPTWGQMVSPTLLDPFVQIDQNKNWFGGPIQPKKFSEHKPDSENFYSTAPAWAIDFARWLNRVSGGDRGKAGAVDVSPESIEHLVEFAGGGVSKFAANIWNTGQRAYNGQEWLPEKTPFVRRLYGKATTESRRRDFFEKWNEVDGTHYQFDIARRNQDRESMARYRAENPVDLAAYEGMRNAQRQLGTLKKQSDAINLNRDLDNVAREQRLKVITDRENEIILRALANYNRLKKEQQKRKDQMQ